MCVCVWCVSKVWVKEIWVTTSMHATTERERERDTHTRKHTHTYTSHLCFPTTHRSHIWMTRHTFEKKRVVSRTWVSHVTHMNESCHTHMNETHHTYEWHVAHLRESCKWYVTRCECKGTRCKCQTYDWVMLHIWIRYITHMNDMSHIWESCANAWSDMYGHTLQI